MSDKWSLIEMYKGFDDEKFLGDIKSIDKNLGEIERISELIVGKDDREILERYIDVISDLEITGCMARDYAELVSSVDTKNMTAQKYSEIIGNSLSRLSKNDSKVKSMIGNIKNLKALSAESEKIKNHEYFISEIIRECEYLLSPEVEDTIAQMTTTGSTAWSKLRDSLTANLMVDINIEGKIKTVPLTVARNMAYDSKQDVRKAAYEGEIASYKKIDTSVAACLNGIKGEVITVSKMRGFETPLDEVMLRSRMSKNILNAMLEAMEEAMPMFRKYMRRKAEILGHKDGLPFYDLFAPIGKLDREIKYDEAQKMVVDNFTTFSKNLGDYAQKVFDRSWVDVYPREGKVGGAYCATIKGIKESRIMHNYGNDFGSVVTLAHELGHGYHGEVLKDESPLKSEYPMPLAETASTFCETILKKAIVKELSKEEALTVIENEVADSTQIICDIMSRFLFEKSVFEKRAESSPSPDELCDLMIEAQLKTYGDGLDKDCMHPYMWLNKGHYYDANYNYYNFPYAFGLLFAKGLYSMYKEQGENFIEIYDTVLKATGSMDVKDVGEIVGIDFEDIGFWRKALKVVEEDVEAFMELTGN